MSTLRFDGRVAVITGGARGLGRAYAVLLASRGARIVVNDTGARPDGSHADSSPAEELVREIRSRGGEAVACLDSVATPQGGAAVIQAAMDNYGKIDILIHSAGNVRHGSLKELRQADFDAVIQVHLQGAFHVVREAFPLMCKARYGRIVLTSSCFGVYGYAGGASYAAAKMGLIGLSNVVALEGAQEGVKCNALLPGAKSRMAEDAGVDTQHFPSTMVPEVVAPAVAWLSHERCSMTGEVLISMAGRVAVAYTAESQGIFRDSWTPEQIDQDMDKIRDRREVVIFPVVPSGSDDHVNYCFEKAREAIQTTVR